MDFSTELDFFWVGIDATGRLKAKVAKNVLILLNFGDSCAVFHESRQS